MMGKKCKCCCFSWLSGMFALACLVHTVRLVTGAQVQINATVIPMNVSLWVAVIAGILSFILCKKSCGACGCSGEAKK